MIRHRLHRFHKFPYVPTFFDTVDLAEVQAPQTQDIAGYAPLREETRITQSQTSGGLDQTQVFDMSTAECLWHLAGLCVNSLESRVNIVYLEPDASRRF
jgi:hypothetical protein